VLERRSGELQMRVVEADVGRCHCLLLSYYLHTRAVAAILVETHMLYCHLV
jgi:hypothetical protein